MKVAVCLSGQPRWFKKAQPFLKKNLIDKFDCDVFMHAWFDPKKVGENYSGAAWTRGKTDQILKNTDKHLISKYKPKLSLIEPQHDYFPSTRPINEYRCTTNGTSANIVFSMFYSMCKSFELREQYENENNFKYDVVVRLRYDYVVLETPDFDLDFDNKVYHTMSPESAYPEKICDWFIYGDSSTMSTVSKIFANLDEYHDKGVGVDGENMLMHHLQVNNIEWKGLHQKGFLARDSDLSIRKWGWG